MWLQDLVVCSFIMKIFNKGSNILLKKEKLILSVYLYDELIQVLEIDSKSFLGFMTLEIWKRSNLILND